MKVVRVEGGRAVVGSRASGGGGAHRSRCSSMRASSTRRSVTGRVAPPPVRLVASRSTLTSWSIGQSGWKPNRSRNCSSNLTSSGSRTCERAQQAEDERSTLRASSRRARGELEAISGRSRGWSRGDLGAISGWLSGAHRARRSTRHRRPSRARAPAERGRGRRRAVPRASGQSPPGGDTRRTGVKGGV